MQTDILTGVRPTGELTIANYLGAILPIIELQNKGERPVIFVADLHALTTNEPKEIKEYITGIVADYLALGIDKTKTIIYLQSDIKAEILELTAYLSRLVSVSELMRVPTLKEKVKNDNGVETANAFLLMYPVMMAADILINKAVRIPVGKDQASHLEMSRLLARRFNQKYGEVFPIPEVLEIKSVNILSLVGQGKMSKSNPKGAILLSDTPRMAEKKIKSAETSVAGVLNDKIESLVLVGMGLAKDPETKLEITELIQEHLDGKQVMGAFKKLLAQVVCEFLKEFQNRKKTILEDKFAVQLVLQNGYIKNKVSETMKEVRVKMEE